MRVSKKILFILCLIISLVTVRVAYAGNDGAGDSSVAIYGPMSGDGWGDSTSRLAGIRITFVDKNGKALSVAPYSYSYYATGYNDVYMVVNNTNIKDKSKVNINSYVKREIKDNKYYLKYAKKQLSATYPSITVLGSKFNSAPTVSGASKTKMNNLLNAKLGGQYDADNGQAKRFFAAANAWFENLTKGNRKYNVARNDVLALAYAISKTSNYSSKIDYNGLEKMLKNNCDDDSQVFIVMEPLVNLQYHSASGWTSGVYGTPAEVYDYIFIHSKQSYWNIKRYAAYLSYQVDEKIINYKAISPIANGADGKYTTYSNNIMYNSDGWGMNLDWLQPEDSCDDTCKITKDGKFYMNGNLVKEPPTGFDSIYEYAFNKKKKKGAKCCSKAKSKYENNKLTPEWRTAYETWCKQPVGECSFDDDGNFYDNNGRKVDTVPSGFTSIAEYAFSSMEKNNKNGADCCDLISKEELTDKTYKREYKRICEKPQDDCCTEEPITPGKIFGEVHNCCYENAHSEMYEYKLNELFCKDSDLNITYYMKKCDTETYTKAINDYCELVCTERVSVDIPSAITATSGRYFELTKSKYDFKSSYIEGYKRCRTIIKFDDWLTKYENAMTKQVEAYNQFQKNEAFRQVYESAYTNRQEKQTSSGYSSITCTKTNDDGTTSTVSGGSCNVEYTKYPTNYQKNYYGVKLVKNGYNSYSIEYDSGVSGSTNFEKSDWAAVITSTSACSEALSSAETSNSSYTCTRTTSEAERKQEDIPAKLAEFTRDAKQAQEDYKAATNDAENLEGQIDTCDHYFDLDSALGKKYDGSNTSEMYKFNPSQSFEYTQKYLDGNGKLQTDVQVVNWKETPGCKVDDNIVLNVPEDNEKDQMINPQYSTKYGSDSIALHDFRNATLNLSTRTNGYQDYLHNSYSADKKFTSDARYHVTCAWDEDENKTYSLVPSGEVSNTKVGQFTYHEKQYKVFISTLSGKYETNWNISKIGERSQFDEYLEYGKTCSGKPVGTKAKFTCGLEIKNNVYKVGECNPDPNDITKFAIDDDKDCDTTTKDYNNFKFKIVDPTDIFPGGTKTNDGKEYAYNWMKTDKGQNTKTAIESDGNSTKTYAPENLSYSFVLNSETMKHIKNYNKSQNSKGGYADFESFKCDCPPTDTAQVCTPTSSEDQTCNNISCTKCKSSFIDNLYNGKITYNGTTYNVKAWKGTSDLATIRSNNNW